ncbi:phospholipase domain-containing protein, partial [Kitasatospora sp. NPDC048365]|uniref:phospholipase domain-containing protein n=1 Tax=Kitasatospora sp. NPDC048365 TaxID=3364050 RepID=UPI003724AB5A
PEVWAKTALFITYDENDGFFDHVVPPFPPSSANQGLSTVATGADYFGGNVSYGAGAYGLGQRVPMLVVSPWSKGGFTCSETFDHTSIIRFMERRFGVAEPNISPWRRAICGDLTAAFDFTASNSAPVTLPSTTGYQPPDRNRHPDYVPAPPAIGTMPKQEAGSKPTRPLKYAPYVDGSANISTGKYALTFSAGAAAGGQFLVTSPNRTDGPWTYTTEAGKTVTDSWNTYYSGGVTDLTVHGPNGFLRRFRSPGKTAGPEVVARHNTGTGNLDLTFTNPAGADAVLTVTNAYAGTPQTVTVRKGATVNLTVGLGTCRNWYDVTITSNVTTDFVRRLAGHVETGAAGLSDPGLITY